MTHCLKADDAPWKKRVQGSVRRRDASVSHLILSLPRSTLATEAERNTSEQCGFQVRFQLFAEICLLFAKDGSYSRTWVLEVGHFKAQARREAWLNGTYIRSIKQSPNHATCSHFMRQTIREGKYKNQCSATNTNFTFCEIHRALAYSCQPFPDHRVMTVLTHCELQTLMFAFTWVIHPEALKNSKS